MRASHRNDATRQLLAELLLSSGLQAAMVRRVHAGLRHEAEDIIGETMCRMMRWPPMDSPANVALADVRRVAGDRWRRKTRSDAASEAMKVEEPPPKPDDDYAREQTRARVRAALATLPAKRAEALRLWAEDVPGDEIAMRLCVPRGTVVSWINRSRDVLRELLADLAA